MCTRHLSQTDFNEIIRLLQRSNRMMERSLCGKSNRNMQRDTIRRNNNLIKKLNKQTTMNNEH